MQDMVKIDPNSPRMTDFSILA